VANRVPNPATAGTFNVNCIWLLDIRSTADPSLFIAGGEARLPQQRLEHARQAIDSAL
jgi:hypothetical protein